MKIRFLAVILLLASVCVFMACQPKEVTSAKVYLQQENWEAATAQLESAVELYPDNAEAHFLLGQAYSHSGEWEKMNAVFEKASSLVPDFDDQINAIRESNWVQSFNKGVNHINGGDIDAAINDFETCTVIDPNRPEAYRNLAIAATQKGDMEKAKIVYAQAVEKNPEDIELVHALVALHFEDKEYAKVVELEKSVLEQNPDDTDAVANLALAYDFMGEKGKAMETYEIALEKNPGATDLLFNKARLHYMNEEYEQAIELFQQVIANDPDDVDANNNVGNAYLSIADNMRKKLVEKENNGEEITQEERDAMKEFYTKSIPYLEKAVAGYPDNPNLWNNLGIAHVQAGNQDRGVECFQKAEELQNQ